MRDSFYDFVQKNYDFGETTDFKEKLFKTYPEEVDRAVAEEDPTQRELSNGLRRREVVEILDAIKVAEIDRYSAEKYKYDVVLYFVDCEKFKDGDSREDEGLSL